MVGLAPTIPSMSNKRAGVRSGPFLFQEKPIRLQRGMARNAFCELGFVPIRAGPLAAVQIVKRRAHPLRF